MFYCCFFLFKELGFKGEIGYQTFLYANEHELRKVMMFLIEKLPKDTAESIDEPLGNYIIIIDILIS